MLLLQGGKDFTQFSDLHIHIYDQMCLTPRKTKEKLDSNLNSWHILNPIISPKKFSIGFISGKVSVHSIASLFVLFLETPGRLALFSLEMSFVK